MNWPRKQGLLVHNLDLLMDHLPGKPINRHRHYATCCFHLDDRRKTLTFGDENQETIRLACRIVLPRLRNGGG
jgi:hypothetical protein